MSVKEIESAIAQLPPTELAELSQWFEEFQAERWDEKIERDAQNGKLSTLAEQAKAEFVAGRCKPL